MKLKLYLAAILLVVMAGLIPVAAMAEEKKDAAPAAAATTAPADAAPAATITELIAATGCSCVQILESE